MLNTGLMKRRTRSRESLRRRTPPLVKGAQESTPKCLDTLVFCFEPPVSRQSTAWSPNPAAATGVWAETEDIERGTGKPARAAAPAPRTARRERERLDTLCPPPRSFGPDGGAFHEADPSR